MIGDDLMITVADVRANSADSVLVVPIAARTMLV
jgi:hypothetical protein